MNEIEIIAEIGVNHNGDYATAVELIDAAKVAGCDTVKFQLWNTERVYPRERWDEMKRLELSRLSIEHLKERSEQVGLRFLCTPDDIDDARFLRKIGVERIKIGSSNVRNLPLLREIAMWRVPVILSSGATTSQELVAAVEAVNPKVMMHCVSGYPAPLAEMNLSCLGYWWDFLLGLSDHTATDIAALIALGLGARVFEKHLTLDTAQAGPDHAASLIPSDMWNYVHTLRAAAEALGDGVKRVMPCEQANRLEYDRFVRQQWENAAHADGAAAG